MTEAEEDVAEAGVATAEAGKAVEDAQAALDALAAEQAAWDEQAKPLREAVEAAEQGVEAAEAELETATAAVTALETQIAEVEQQIEELKDAADQATTLVVEDYGDFLVWCAQNGYQSGTNGLSNAFVLLYGNVFNELENDGTGHLTADYIIGNAAIHMEDKWEWSNEFQGYLYTGKELCEYTDLNDSSDASDLDNVLASLDIVDAANELREQAGLEPLQITQEMMIISILDANWSAANMEVGNGLDHAANAIAENNPYMPNGMNVAENLAAGYDAEGAVQAWYDEKSVWEEFCQENYGTVPAPGDALDFFFEHQDDPEMQAVYGSVSHYLNLMSKDYTVTGAAMTDGVTGQVYNYSNSYTDAAVSWEPQHTDGERYTTDQLRDLINQAIEEGMDNPFIDPDTGSNEEQIAELEAELEALRGELETAQQTQTEKEQAVERAEEALAVAEQNLAAIGERPDEGTLQADYEAAKAAYDEVVANEQAAEENLATVKQQVVDTVSDLSSQKDTLEAQLADAQSQIDQLSQAAEDALAELDALKDGYADLADAAASLDAAQANYDEAVRVASDAQGARDALYAVVAQLAADVDAKRAEVEAAKAAAEAAGPTAGQIEALEDAQAALDAAQAELERLTEARDAAQEVVDEVQSAVDAGAELVAELTDAAAEQQALVDEVDARLTSATAEAEAWETAFGQQDAESIVTDGFAGTVADDGVADALAGAHLSYQEKVDLLASAQSELEAAQAALEAAKADKETTAAELAAAEADYAVAKEAYDRLVAMLGSGEGTVEVPEEPEEPEAVRPGGQRTPEQQAQLEALPQTGDPTSFAAAGGMVLAGAAAVAAAVVGGAHFRRHAE